MDRTATIKNREAIILRSGNSSRDIIFCCNFKFRLLFVLYSYALALSVLHATRGEGAFLGTPEFFKLTIALLAMPQ